MNSNTVKDRILGSLKSNSYLGCLIYGDTGVLHSLFRDVKLEKGRFFPVCISVIKDFKFNINNDVRQIDAFSLIGSENTVQEWVRKFSSEVFSTGFFSADRPMLYRGSDLLTLDLSLNFYGRDDVAFIYEGVDKEFVLNALEGAPVGKYLLSKYGNLSSFRSTYVYPYTYFYGGPNKDVFDIYGLVGAFAVKSLLKVSTPPVYTIKDVTDYLSNSVFGASMESNFDMGGIMNMSFVGDLYPVGVSLFTYMGGRVSSFFRAIDLYIASVDVDFNPPVLQSGLSSFFNVNLSLKSTGVVSMERVEQYFNL